MSLERKLNPPQIESKLPAFYGMDIDIPFNITRAVSDADFNKVAVTIKTVQNNVEKLYMITSTVYQDSSTMLYHAKVNVNDYNAQFYSQISAAVTDKTMYTKTRLNTFIVTTEFIVNNTYVCNYPEKLFTPVAGQYYKVQIALVNQADDAVGYYSSVGVIKCTSKPHIEIQNQEDNQQHKYTYTGVYSQENGDTTEKVYSYCFNLYNDKNELVATSGELIHNASKDKDYNKSTDTWTVRKNLDANIIYEIEYNVTTINGLADTSGRYTIIESETQAPNVHATLHAINNFDEGYTVISLKGNGDNVLINGRFILMRSSSEDNFDSWYELTKFDLSNWNSSTENEIICKDRTVQQGIQYLYAIRAYNSVGLFSNRMMAEEGAITADFEDAFLYDGERQLKIRFNPKVSSFKSTILESKTDTIGGKYPFVFRNGNVEYKEFQISGLISLLGDENNEFLSGLAVDPNAVREDAGHQLTTDNIRRERQFKMQVLSWLTNGKPKLFRSPAEGNFIIRLMNTSLAPNDTLGRMLHTFTSTAYEIAEFNFDNLKAYGFAMEDYIELRTLRMAQLKDAHLTDSITLPSAVYASIVAKPGTIFRYTLEKMKVTAQIEIGKTGTYIFPSNVLLATPLVQLDMLTGEWGTDGSVTYGYYDTTADDFSIIHNIALTDKIIQIIGQGDSYNIITNNLEDIRCKAGAFHYIKIEPRSIVKIYEQNGKYYYNSTKQLVEGLNKNTLYYIYDGFDTVDANGNRVPAALTDYYFDGALGITNPPRRIRNINYNFYISGMSEGSVVDFNGEVKGNPDTQGRYEALTNISSIGEMYAGDGLLLDIVYQQKEIVYVVEAEGNDHCMPYILADKAAWQAAQDDYYNAIASNASNAVINAKEAEMNRLYSIYINHLKYELEMLREEYDVEYAL